MKNWRMWWVGALLATLAACGSGRHSPAGFRLPENGDPERGRAAFVALKCVTCHRVFGEDLPAPTVDPPVPVVLGGRVHEIRTDGYLVTSIIHPSHRITGFPREQVVADGASRMPDPPPDMTVSQLVDIVAFLQERYEVVPAPVMYH